MRVPVSAMVLLVTSAGLLAQLATQPPAFDVASVKPTEYGTTAEGTGHSSLSIASPGRFVALNANLSRCIRWAYAVREDQIAGPFWLNSDNESYDIEGKAPGGTTTEQVRQMVQTLLAERFKLRLHHETKMFPVYWLVKAKNGTKLRPGSVDGRQNTSSERGRIKAQNITMAALAAQLVRVTGQPVVDKTELQGAFDLELSYAPDEDTSGRRPSIYTAVQEQLGLKLEATKGPQEVLVIDHAERPSGN